MTFPRSLALPALVLVGLVAGALAVAESEPARVSDTEWREPLSRAETALAGGDARQAESAVGEAYWASMSQRTPQGMLAVGRAYLRLSATSREAAVAQARRMFLEALFQARARNDADGVASAAEAFAALGDREVADRACHIGMSLALQNGDVDALKRLVAIGDEVRSMDRVSLDTPLRR